MKRSKQIWLSALAVLFLGAVVGGVIWWKRQIHWGPSFGATSPEEWIEKAAARANGFKPRPWSRRPRIFEMNEGRFELWLEGTGLVEFQDGNWVYIVTHSFHQDRTLWIGDICMARDNHGRFWQCDAHPCSCITLEPESREGFRNLDEFLGKPVGLGDKKWERLTLPNKGTHATK